MAATALVGVVVPAHNAASWLPAAIGSLQRQQHENWSCVIVDDGSADDTLAVARGLAGSDGRVTVLATPNTGASVARNSGTALLPSGARLVSFLDADDVLQPHAFRRLVEALEGRPDAVGSYGLAEYVDEQGRPLAPGEHIRRQRDRRAVRGLRLVDVGPGDDATFDEMVVNGPIWPSCVGLLRREVVAAVGSWNGALRRLTDWDLYVRMSRQGPFVAVDEQVALYRRHRSNITNDSSAMVRTAAGVPHSIWSDPANDRRQRRLTARAWRYLQLRECLMMTRQGRRAVAERRYRGALRAGVGAVVGGLETLAPGPPSVSWTFTDLTVAVETAAESWEPARETGAT